MRFSDRKSPERRRKERDGDEERVRGRTASWWKSLFLGLKILIFSTCRTKREVRKGVPFLKDKEEKKRGRGSSSGPKKQKNNKEIKYIYTDETFSSLSLSHTRTHFNSGSYYDA